MNLTVFDPIRATLATLEEKSNGHNILFTTLFLCTLVESKDKEQFQEYLYRNLNGPGKEYLPANIDPYKHLSLKEIIRDEPAIWGSLEYVKRKAWLLVHIALHEEPK